MGIWLGLERWVVGREVQAGGTTYMGVEPEVSRNGKYKKIMWQVCMWSEQEEWGMGDGT